MRILAIAVSVLLLSQGVAAQVPQLGDLLPPGDASTSGRIIQYVLLLTVLSVAPSILIMVTSFTLVYCGFLVPARRAWNAKHSSQPGYHQPFAVSDFFCHGSNI